MDPSKQHLESIKLIMSHAPPDALIPDPYPIAARPLADNSQSSSSGISRNEHAVVGLRALPVADTGYEQLIRRELNPLYDQSSAAASESFLQEAGPSSRPAVPSYPHTDLIGQYVPSQAVQMSTVCFSMLQNDSSQPVPTTSSTSMPAACQLSVQYHNLAMSASASTASACVIPPSPAEAGTQSMDPGVSIPQEHLELYPELIQQLSLRIPNLVAILHDTAPNLHVERISKLIASSPLSPMIETGERASSSHLSSLHAQPPAFPVLRNRVIDPDSSFPRVHQLDASTMPASFPAPPPGFPPEDQQIPQGFQPSHQLTISQDSLAQEVIAHHQDNQYQPPVPIRHQAMAQSSQQQLVLDPAPHAEDGADRARPPLQQLPLTPAVVAQQPDHQQQPRDVHLHHARFVQMQQPYQALLNSIHQAHPLPRIDQPVAMQHPTIHQLPPSLAVVIQHDHPHHQPREMQRHPAPVALQMMAQSPLQNPPAQHRRLIDQSVAMPRPTVQQLSQAPMHPVQPGQPALIQQHHQQMSQAAVAAMSQQRVPIHQRGAAQPHHPPAPMQPAQPAQQIMLQPHSSQNAPHGMAAFATTSAAQQHRPPILQGAQSFPAAHEQHPIHRQAPTQLVHPTQHAQVQPPRLPMPQRPQIHQGAPQPPHPVAYNQQQQMNANQQFMAYQLPYPGVLPPLPHASKVPPSDAGRWLALQRVYMEQATSIMQQHVLLHQQQIQHAQQAEARQRQQQQIQAQLAMDAAARSAQQQLQAQHQLQEQLAVQAVAELAQVQPRPAMSQQAQGVAARTTAAQPALLQAPQQQVQPLEGQLPSGNDGGSQTHSAEEEQARRAAAEAARRQVEIEAMTKVNATDELRKLQQHLQQGGSNQQPAQSKSQDMSLKAWVDANVMDRSASAVVDSQPDVDSPVLLSSVQAQKPISKKKGGPPRLSDEVKAARALKKQEEKQQAKEERDRLRKEKKEMKEREKIISKENEKKSYADLKSEAQAIENARLILEAERLRTEEEEKKIPVNVLMIKQELLDEEEMTSSGMSTGESTLSHSRLLDQRAAGLDEARLSRLATKFRREERHRLEKSKMEKHEVVEIDEEADASEDNQVKH